MSDLFDAIVAGAGPAGSEVAYRLARSGHRVLVLEKGPLFREKPCGGGIQTQEVVEFGPFDDEVLERRISSARVYASDGQCLEIPQYGNHRGATVRRAVFDAHLQDRARDAGAELLAHHPVIDVEWEDGRVTVETRGGVCDAVAVETDHVLADGSAVYAQKAGWSAADAEGFIKIAGNSSAFGAAAAVRLVEGKPSAVSPNPAGVPA